ncbi:unnamed protein product, partial [Meganyctiphanes norvegica]
MGRKKIQISRITDERNRQVTFNKRKFGVMKKAYELSVLCDCEIALIIFSSSNKLYQYASTDMDKVLLKYTEYNEPHESLTNKNIIEALNKKEHKNGLQSPDSPDGDTDYNLTPRTEAKYNKIDEEFTLMMQRNHLNGNRQPMGMNNYNSMSVTVPVNANSYDPGLMQPSPQMSHASLSPRPGSSNAMIDMNGSNGYPGSTSPLPHGGAPSPGLLTRPHSSKTHSPTRPNLRVLIPQSQVQNISPGPRPGSPSLNTPVVSLQSGNAQTMTSYTSFQHQDFPLNTADISLNSLNSLHQWNSGNISQTGGGGGIGGHSGLPHLSVSSSTPPPAPSPPVRIKAEPISPPRDPNLPASHIPRSSANDLGHLSPAPPTHLNLSSNHLHQSSLYQNSLGTGHLTPTSHASPEGASHHEYDTPLSKRPRLSEGWTT